MIKTLHITSVVAAVLAAGFLVFPVVFGLRSDQEMEQFLSSPTVVDKFRQAEGKKTTTAGAGQVSPLVRQAEAFALYLNPPQPEKQQRGRAKRPVERSRDAIPTPPIATAKFTVVATSFYQSAPEMSLALIEEPGKGRHWVRPSNVVSHLTIEQIKDGAVVVRGPKGTQEIPVATRPQKRSLLADSSPVAAIPGVQTGPARAADVISVEQPASRAPAPTASGTAPPQRSPEEEDAWAQKIFAQLKAAAEAEAAEAGSPEPTGQASPVPETGRITGEEAEKLDRLGRELETVRRDPARAKIKTAREGASPPDRVDREKPPRPGSREERRARLMKRRIERAREMAERAKQRATENDNE